MSGDFYNDAGTPTCAAGGYDGGLGGGVFRTGSGSYRYVDGRKVRVPDQVACAPKPKPKPKPRRTIPRNARPVIAPATGREWPTITACAMSLGVSRDDVRKAIKGGEPIRGIELAYREDDGK